MKCTFQVNRTNPATGNKQREDCEEKAATYRCSGQLTSINMPLCDFHKQYLTTKYKWTLKEIHEHNETKSVSG